MGQAAVTGSRTVVWPNGAKAHAHTIMFWAKSWQAIGGQTALSKGAALYLGHQLEELAQNPDMQPVFIQWTATDEGGGVLNTTDPHDGWYVISDLQVDYHTAATNGYLQVTAAVSLVATAPPRGLGQSYFGGALTTTFSGGSQIAIGYPFNAANQPATAVSRTGGEGAIPLSVAPAANLNPLPFNPSATVGDWFKGGVRVWDTINTSSNAVPLAGLSVNANWVEVFQSDHRYEGDCVVTNGLLLLIFIAGQSRVCRAYVWSTGLATPAWQQVGDLQSNDNASAAYTLRSYKVERIGLEETRIVTNSTTTGGNQTEVAVRLQRGAFFGRADVRPLSQASTVNTVLFWTFATNIKIAYNSTAVSDPAISVTSLGVVTDYGYTAGFTANSAQPFISGLLNLNKPNAAPGNAVGSVNVGDTTTPLQNAIGSYGFFAVPFGVNASYSTASLQTEAETGPTAPFVSVADAAQSGGNVLKLPSGTAMNTAVNAFGTSWTPAGGTYAVWARMKVTATNSANSQFTIWVTRAVGGDTLITGYSPNNLTTSYAWYLLGVTTVTTQTGFGFKAQGIGSGSTTTDWFIDEMVLVPLTLSAANTGPQENWQQLLHDRTVRLTRI